MAQTRSTVIPVDDTLANPALSLASDLVRASAARLRQLALGSPEKQALRRRYKAALKAMLARVAAGLDADRLVLVEDIFRRFVNQPEVAQALLDLALAGAGTPDLPAPRRAFDVLEFDRATLPVDFDAALTAFQNGLAAALLEEAGRADSPLFNQVNLGQVLAVESKILCGPFSLAS